MPSSAARMVTLTVRPLQGSPTALPAAGADCFRVDVSGTPRAADVLAVADGVPAAVAVLDGTGSVDRATRAFLDRFDVSNGSLARCPVEVDAIAAGDADSLTTALDGVEANLVAAVDSVGRRLVVLTIPDAGDAAESDQLSPVLQEPLDESPAIIWLKDLEGRYIRVNRRYVDEIGTDAERVCGRTDHELTSMWSIEGMRLAEEDSAAGRELLELEYRIGAFEERPAFTVLRFALHNGEGQPTTTCSVAAPATEESVARSECERLMRIDRWGRLDVFAIRQELLEQWGLMLPDGKPDPPIDRHDSTRALTIERDQALVEVARLKNLVEEHEQQLSRNDGAEGRAGELESAVSAEQARSGQLEQSLAQAQARVSELETAAAADETRGGELETAVGVERARAGELGESLAQAQARVGELEVELTSVHGQLEDHGHVDELEAAVVEQRARAEELESAVSAEQARSGQLEQSLAQAQARVSELETAAAADETRGGELETAVGVERARAGELGESLAQAQARVGELEVELTSVHGQLEDHGHVDELEAAVVEQRARAGELESAVSAEQARSGQLEQSLAQAQARVSELETAAAADETRGGELEAAVVEQRARAGELESAVSAEQARSGQLEQSLAQAQARVSELETAAAADETRGGELETAVGVERARAGELGESLAQAQARVGELEVELTSVHGQLEDHGHVDELEAAVVEQRARAGELESAVSAEQARSGQLEQSLAQAQARVSELETELTTTVDVQLEEPRAPGGEAPGAPASESSSAVRWDGSSQRALSAVLVGLTEWRSVLEHAVDTLGGEGGWDAAIAWYLERPGAPMTCAAIWTGDGAGLASLESRTWKHRVDASTGEFARARTRMAATCLLELQSAEDPLLRVAAAEGMGSALLVPIIDGSDTIATIALFSRTAAPPGAELMVSLDAIALQLGAIGHICRPSYSPRWGVARV